MEYVNKLIVHGNTYEIQDKSARTQLYSIANQVSNNTNSLNKIREDIDIISEVTASSLTDIDTRLNKIREDIDVTASSLTDINTRLKKIEEILAYISYI